jgi:hypothetical protein
VPDGALASVALPREFLGKARAIRNLIAAEDDQYDAQVHQIFVPVLARLTRHPDRSPRQEMLAAFARDWDDLPSDWRLDCSIRLERTSLAINEVRIAAGIMKHANWPGGEDDIGVTALSVTLGKNTARLKARCLCCFSLHALSRRLQRHHDTSTASLLYDINLVAEAAMREPVVTGAGYRITTTTNGGGWRGRGLRLNSPDGAADVLSVRTWIE